MNAERSSPVARLPPPLLQVPGVRPPPPERAAAALATGSWIGSTLGDALRATAARVPERAAFISEERTLSFATLDADTERLAAALLTAGLAPGDRAVFQLGTTVETAVALLACYKAGIVPVCSLPQHREVEIGQLTQLSGARGYFVQADFSERFDLVAFARQMAAIHTTLQHLVVVRGAAPAASSRTEAPGAALHGLQALIDGMPLEAARERLRALRLSPLDLLSFQLSGGTTGVPKIIPRFHGEYMGHAAGWMRRYRIDDGCRLIWALPLLHNAGQLYTLVPAALLGVGTVLMARPDALRMLELIAEYRVTHALSIGPIAPQLMALPDVRRHDLSSLRLFATMGRADALEAHLGVPCSNLYGITEGLLLGTPADAPAEARHHTQGASGNADDEIRLLDPDTEQPVPPGQPGELCFRGPSSLTGYVGHDEANSSAFTSDGLYRSGDMVTAHFIDGLWHYRFEGRLRDNINRGGEKIGCEEVEAFVSRHPAVADAKLVAMPDALYGEKGCVYLVLRPGHAAPSVGELGAFLVAQGLARYKCPERVEVIDAYPVTRVGKVDKPALKRHIAARLAAESGGEADATDAASTAGAR